MQRHGTISRTLVHPCGEVRQTCSRLCPSLRTAGGFISQMPRPHLLGLAGYVIGVRKVKCLFPLSAIEGAKRVKALLSVRLPIVKFPRARFIGLSE